VLGPGAASVLARLDLPMPAAPYGHAPPGLPDTETSVVRVPSPGVGGVLVRVPLTAAAEWWKRCCDQGSAVAAGIDAFESVRIESGVPWHGRDVTGDTLALEAPYETAISFRKGCYLGQEVMERVTARGHVNRKLVGVEVAEGTVLTPGAALFAGDREVGRLTSVAHSWRLARMIALAYVRREHLLPGTVLVLGAPGGSPVTVRALPF
jgi:folate-binding protein YgfZ